MSAKVQSKRFKEHCKFSTKLDKVGYDVWPAIPSTGKHMVIKNPGFDHDLS